MLGCDLLWVEDAPPSVTRHPLAHQKTIPTHLPKKSDGRLPLILNTMQAMTSAVGERTALLGLVTGPLSLAFHLRGHQLFFDLMDDPAYLRTLITYTTRMTQYIAGLYLEAGIDVIGVIEPVASQISPADFQAFLLNPLQKVFHHIHDADGYGMLHICGKATQIIEAMCLTGADILSLDKNVNIPEIQAITDRYQVILQGNIPVISHLLEGRPEDVKRYIDNLIAQLPSPQNLILSPGCDLPWDTPVENMLAALESVKNHLLLERMIP
jgi:uroporphyrinogen decarboxylase